MRPRDLTGYGGHPAAIVWPNGARVAVSLVVNFEEGAELCIGDGDDTNEPIGEVASVVQAGRRDSARKRCSPTVHAREYGAFWRPSSATTAWPHSSCAAGP